MVLNVDLGTLKKHYRDYLFNRKELIKLKIQNADKIKLKEASNKATEALWNAIKKIEEIEEKIARREIRYIRSKKSVAEFHEIMAKIDRIIEKRSRTQKKQHTKPKVKKSLLPKKRPPKH